MKWIKKHFVTLIIIVALLAGLGLLLYPSVADYWNRFHQSRAVMRYTEAVEDMDQAEYEKCLSDARAYNQQLAEKGIHWELSEEEHKEYESLLNITQTGIMGYITIEKINVSLPIYHGTSEDILQKSIGHLTGTSLPVGTESYDEVQGVVANPEEGVHSVVSGHRGLPSARLFSDLDEMEEGDIFTLNILHETYTYQVDQIKTVEPDDLSCLVVEKGRDYCTLMTCTPYGINTQRLLVRGRRATPISLDEVPAEKDPKTRLLLVIILGVLVILILFISFYIRKHKNNKTD